MYGQKSGLEAAVAAAAKVDASLHAKGKLTKTLPEGLSKSDVSKIIQAEFSINHVPQSMRNLLCKGSTQEIIKDFSGACVSTKGRYIPESERKNINLQDKSAKNLGLYLFIQGPSKRSVDLAIQKIEEMIASNAEANAARNSVSGPVLGPVQGPGLGQSPGPNPVPNAGSNAAPVPIPPTIPGPGGQIVRPGANVPPALMSLTMQLPPPIIEQHPSGKFIEKIPIGMDNVLPGFNLPMKLIGQGGSNLNYIKNETGAIVTLRGIGSAFVEPGTQQEAPEPLHFCITHHKPDVMATARDLTLNLIATVQQEYAQYQMQQPPPQNPPAQIQQMNVEPPPNLVLHQPGAAEHSIIQQSIPGVMSTSIALPVVQTSFMQQPVTQLTAPPPMVGVPPHFSQPPPAQVALPPPGVHIPQQQGPLVPPAAQHLQIQHQHEQPNNFIQQIAQPFQPGQQPGQQQYVITQNGQPMQGIMTSQGLVVLNQQPQPTYTQQQVFLSQPPPVGQTQPVFQPGQHLTFQSATNQPIHAAVSAPVSYQFQYVQQNPPPGMTYSAIQNPLQTQHSPLQIQPPQHQPLPQNQVGGNGPHSTSGQSPVQHQHQPSQNPHVNQPPPSLPNQSPTMQNPPPNQRHSPNLQGPPPNQPPNPNFPIQTAPNHMVLQQLQNPQIIHNNQHVPIQNQNIQTIPVSTANLLPGQTQLMQIQGIRPPNEVQNAQFQLQQPNYNQYQQQVVMKQVQVCQPQQFQFVPGYPPMPVQFLPAAPGQFMAPPQQQQQQHPPQFNQNQEVPQEPKSQKRKFTEEISPPPQQGQPPQSLMSIPMQPPQPVPPPAQPVTNNAPPGRQGVGVQELMIMNQQQRQQHLQQSEGQSKDPSQKGEESTVVQPPPPSTGNQPFAVPQSGSQEDDKSNQQRQWFEENQMNRDLANRENRDNRHEAEREQDERGCGFTRRRERPTFSHYSSKPQMYDNAMAQYPIRGFSMCPPPPPPPPPLINQPQPPPQQPSANYYYQNNRPY